MLHYPRFILGRTRWYDEDDVGGCLLSAKEDAGGASNDCVVHLGIKGLDDVRGGVPDAPKRDLQIRVSNLGVRHDVY